MLHSVIFGQHSQTGFFISRHIFIFKVRVQGLKKTRYKLLQVAMALRVLGDRCRAVADITSARCLQGVELPAVVKQVADA
jgi:hypothetical protein